MELPRYASVITPVIDSPVLTSTRTRIRHSLRGPAATVVYARTSTIRIQENPIRSSLPIDRISRSLFDAVAVLDELRRHDVRLVTLADGISFDGPYGQLMYALVAGLAELEREAIRERVRVGLRAARARGVRTLQRRLPSRRAPSPPRGGLARNDRHVPRCPCHRRSGADHPLN